MTTRPDITARLWPLASLLVSAGLLFSSIARAADATGLPAAPAGFILDEARALPDDAQAALSAEIAQFSKATGCQLWLVTTTYLSDGSTLRDRSLALSHAWISSGHGFVLSYDRATDSHVLSPSDSLWQVYPTPALIEAFREAGAIIQDKKPPLDLRLISGVRTLMKRLSEAEQQRQMHNQLLPGRDLWAAMVFFVLLVGAALASAIVFATLRRRDADNAVRYFFPQADGALRFGAPYGGGVIAEVSVSPPR